MKFPQPNSRLLTDGSRPLVRMPDAGGIASVQVLSPPVNEAGSSLMHLVELIGRHKWKMIALIVLLTAAAGVISRSLQPLYESTAIVRIDRHSSGGVIGLEAGQAVSFSDMDQIMATQLEIIQSDP